MSAIVFDDPCILFALGRESAPFRREFRPHQRFPGAPCWARFCGPSWLSVLVLETGVGPTAAATALDWLLSGPLVGNVPYRPKLVLSAGFSGALQSQYQIGDILLATEVIDLDGNRWPTTWPGALPPGAWRPPLHRAALLASSRIIADPVEKRRLGEQTGAAAVDMESAIIARHCTRRGVPFGCVRAISDAADTALSSRLTALLAGGRVSPFRLASSLVRSPWLARELWRLAGDTRLASRQLGTALGELLTLTLPGGKDL